jgi:hypothetical protein
VARPGTKGALPYKGQSPFFSFLTAPDLALTAAVLLFVHDAVVRRAPAATLSFSLSRAPAAPRSSQQSARRPALQPRAAAPSAPSVARAGRRRPRGHARPHRRPSPAPRACGCMQRALFRALFSFSKILQNFPER